MAVQKKQTVIPPSQGPLSTRTVESQKRGNRCEGTGENGSYSKPNSQAKRAAWTLKSAQMCNAAAAASNGQNVDERLRAARQRREEHQKLIASRESTRLEREQRARRYYEQQLQERKKKLLEQRLKEERRRAAVEEKRRQRLKEEKERYESAVRKTLEKSQRAQQNLSQNPRGRKLTKNLPRRLPLTAWEEKLISRLLTPTCSYLARSKSAACQSGDEVSFHSANTPAIRSPHRPQPHTGSVHHRSSASPGPDGRRVDLAQTKAARRQDGNRKSSTAVGAGVKPARVAHGGTPPPSPERTPRRSISRHSTPLQLELPSVPEEDAAVCSSALAPGNSRPDRTSAEGHRNKASDENPPGAPCLSLPDSQTGDGTPRPSEVGCRPSAGTTDPEEASRLLAEKRKEARLQREREEQERLHREEAERRSREEAARRAAEERARQQAEAQRLVEEKKRREEEEQRRAEEERAQAMREAALLQKQREEEQAKERAKAEQMQREREILAQKEEAERQARKKRLEEIMRRTRRTDSPDTRSVAVRILPGQAQPKENTEPVHNGSIDDDAKVPAVGTKSSPLRLSGEEDVVPIVAFKERRSLRTLTGLEEIQTHQRAEVI